MLSALGFPEGWEQALRRFPHWHQLRAGWEALGAGREAPGAALCRGYMRVCVCVCEHTQGVFPARSACTTRQMCTQGRGVCAKRKYHPWWHQEHGVGVPGPSIGLGPSKVWMRLTAGGCRAQGSLEGNTQVWGPRGVPHCLLASRRGSG